MHHEAFGHTSAHAAPAGLQSSPAGRAAEGRTAALAHLSYAQGAAYLAPGGGLAASREPIQLAGRGSAAGSEEVARAGVGGAASPLPFLDRIQASFGGHDVSGVRAQVGGAAAGAAREMDAQAYATGGRVGFAHAPDLHTAAHEAAHVVQQQRGVSLLGGVGRAGDPYEEHADRVADRVVAGRSAEDLLSGAPGGGGSATGAVQHSREGREQDLLGAVEDLHTYGEWAAHRFDNLCQAAEVAGFPQAANLFSDCQVQVNALIGHLGLDRVGPLAAGVNRIRRVVEELQEASLQLLEASGIPTDVESIAADPEGVLAGYGAYFGAVSSSLNAASEIAGGPLGSLLSLASNAAGAIPNAFTNLYSSFAHREQVLQEVRNQVDETDLDGHLLPPSSPRR